MKRAPADVDLIVLNELDGDQWRTDGIVAKKSMLLRKTVAASLARLIAVGSVAESRLAQIGPVAVMGYRRI